MISEAEGISGSIQSNRETQRSIKECFKFNELKTQ